jgi:hypothetical protein
MTYTHISNIYKKLLSVIPGIKCTTCSYDLIDINTILPGILVTYHRPILVPARPVVFNLGYAYPQGYVKTSYEVCNIKT